MKNWYGIVYDNDIDLVKTVSLGIQRSFEEADYEIRTMFPTADQDDVQLIVVSEEQARAMFNVLRGRFLKSFKSNEIWAIEHR